jgi:hypothetical protein
MILFFGPIIQETLDLLDVKPAKEILKSWLFWPFTMTLFEFRNIIFVNFKVFVVYIKNDMIRE